MVIWYWVMKKAGGRRSLEAAVMKKVGLWLVINFFIKKLGITLL